MQSVPPPSPNADYWRRCSSCKKPIGYSIQYWVCNVSTCNRKRTGLIFCDVSCWDAHLPLMNHRESWAEERKAPTFDEWSKTLAAGDEKITRKRTPKEETAPPVSTATKMDAPKTILRRPKSE